MNNLYRLTALLALLAAIGLAFAWVVFFSAGEQATSSPDEGHDEALSWYAAGAYEVGIAVEPATPRVGSNELTLAVRLPGGGLPEDTEVSAVAEMPAMGAMPAMRASADLVSTADGRFMGTLDLSMRGAWPLTVTVSGPAGQARIAYDLATDRPGLSVASGGRPIGKSIETRHEGHGPHAGERVYPAFNVDSRRRQLIGLETAAVSVQALAKTLRTIGIVKTDERRRSTVTLKFDAWIGELDANYLGAPVRRGDRLFTVYSPDLLAAQKEYLVAYERANARGGNEALLDAARQRLGLWGVSGGQLRQLQERGEAREYLPVYATVDGVVVEKAINAGSAIKAGQALLKVADFSQVWVEAEIYETDFTAVHVGMPVTVQFADPALAAVTAKVDYIYPYLADNSRSGRIRVTLDNPGGALRPDMYADVLIRVELGERLAVPEEAVLIAGDRRIVFVDIGDGALQPRHIETGRRAGGLVEVLAGVKAGEQIVTSGNFLIAAEAKLKAGISQW